MHCTHMLCASSRSLPLVLDEILLLFASIVRYESALARVLVCPHVPVLPPIFSSLEHCSTPDDVTHALASSTARVSVVHAGS